MRVHSSQIFFALFVYFVFFVRWFGLRMRASLSGRTVTVRLKADTTYAHEIDSSVRIAGNLVPQEGV